MRTVKSPQSLNKSRKQIQANLLHRFVNEVVTKDFGLFQVKDKMDEVHGMLAGTKTSIDHLVPKSEELLSQTQRQERAISNIHSDLREKTNAIMKELGQVERELIVTNSQQPPNTASSRNERLEAMSARLQRVRLTQPPISMPLVREQNEFTTNEKVSEHESKEDSSESEDITTTRGPSVIFPSIENKPIVANSSFTAQYGKNKFGVEVSHLAGRLFSEPDWAVFT